MAKLRIDEEGVAHLPGCGHNSYETLCGFCDTKQRYKEREGTPECYCCIRAALDLMTVTTASEIKSWKERSRPAKGAAGLEGGAA